MSRKPTHPNFIPKYTREDKQVFFDALRELKGDVRRAAKKCGYSVMTVRYWMKKADETQIDAETAKLIREWKGDVDVQIEKLLFKTLNSAEKSLQKATLPQKMEAAAKMVTMLNGLRRPPRETEPPAPGQEDAEQEALAILARVSRRQNGSFERPIDEVSEEPQ